ncbi:hypothetical protein BDN67DRAFT_985602 [Paxillus ammoniavirescens]|nr:hypothetical protein BDN67DRAFT_985602 [Paxillus ammoniavirescens]
MAVQLELITTPFFMPPHPFLVFPPLLVLLPLALYYSVALHLSVDGWGPYLLAISHIPLHVADTPGQPRQGLDWPSVLLAISIDIHGGLDILSDSLSYFMIVPTLVPATQIGDWQLAWNSDLNITLQSLNVCNLRPLKCDEPHVCSLGFGMGGGCMLRDIGAPGWLVLTQECMLEITGRSQTQDSSSMLKREGSRSQANFGHLPGCSTSASLGFLNVWCHFWGVPHWGHCKASEPAEPNDIKSTPACIPRQQEWPSASGTTSCISWPLMITDSVMLMRNGAVMIG